MTGMHAIKYYAVSYKVWQGNSQNIPHLKVTSEMYSVSASLQIIARYRVSSSWVYVITYVCSNRDADLLHPLSKIAPGVSMYVVSAHIRYGQKRYKCLRDNLHTSNMSSFLSHPEQLGVLHYIN